MRKVLILLSVFCCLAFSGVSEAWELKDKTGPFDLRMAQNIQKWRLMHNWELSTLLTDRQQWTFDQIVRGTLNWAYTRGNFFDRDEFLDTFKDRDSSVLLISYPGGGVGLVIRGAYIRVELDKSGPEALVTNETVSDLPGEGRWYAEIGCSSHSQIFYFLAATSTANDVAAGYTDLPRPCPRQ